MILTPERVLARVLFKNARLLRLCKTATDEEFAFWWSINWETIADWYNEMRP